MGHTAIIPEWRGISGAVLVEVLMRISKTALI